MSTNNGDRERALELIRRFGWNNTSFQTLEPAFEYWFDPAGPGVVAYINAWGTWVAAGAPIAPPDRVRACALGFAEAAGRSGARVCFFGTLEWFVREMGEAAGHVKIGEQPWWNPALWDAPAGGGRGAASQIRRASRRGVRVRGVAASEMEREDSEARRMAQSVIDVWRESRPMATMGFMVDIDPFTFPHLRRYYLAEGENGPVGFLALIPVYARNGWFLEDLIRRPDAPNGTAEMLVDAAMRGIAAEGAGYATLGLAPLRGIDLPGAAGPGWALLTFRLAVRFLDPLYSFNGLAAFKAKFRPDGWEDVHLVGIPAFTPAMLLSVLVAFTRMRPATFAWVTIVRLLRRGLLRLEPGGWRWISYAFAILLLIWTGLLFLADGRYWFGDVGIKGRWIAFDLAMVGVFTWLGWGAGRRATFVSWLAPAAFIAVLVDLLLTAVEAIDFHRSGLRGLPEHLIWGAALCGPLLAAAFLGALGHAALRHRSSPRRVSTRKGRG